MKISSLTINGIGGIKNLTMNFHEGFNVICGANGVGKTTILNIIADAFTGAKSVLKRNSQFDQGDYFISFGGVSGAEKKKTMQVKEFDPNSNDLGRSASEETPYVMIFNINRMLDYRGLDGVPKDQSLNKYQIGNTMAFGVKNDDLKGWFVNRYLFVDKEGSLSENQKENYYAAQDSFSLLDENIRFKTVDSASLDIKLESPRGDIYFEYLSAGYKTCIYIILGIIKELEFRFKDPYVRVVDFSGVILIDEIDLHLHPSWQAKLVQTLKKVFPNAQFIVTTHSPSVLQCLEKDEIIPLTIDAQGNVTIKPLNLGPYGLQGWTIEEILHDVMEMPTTSSMVFKSVMDDYDRAMNENDVERIKKNYSILCDMLHPESTLRRLLDIQIAGLEE